MATKPGEARELSASDGVPPRNVRLLRAAVLLLVGLTITFSAPQHANIEFDVAMLTLGLSLIGVATVAEYFAVRNTTESWWVAARATVALAAAGAGLAIVDTASMALVIAIWAGLTALITLMRWVRGVQPRSIALPSLLLSLALTVAVLITHDDPVAVIGFFGAYALVRGVFLGIAAFDPRKASTEAAEDHTVENGANNE